MYDNNYCVCVYRTIAIWARRRTIVRWRRRRRHLSSTTGARFTRVTSTQVQILTQEAMQTVHDGQGSEENASKTYKNRPDNSRGMF